MNEDSFKLETAKMALIKTDSELPQTGYPLEAILSDREALDCFRGWITSDPNRSPDGLDLYFAIQGFRQAMDRNDPKSITIASQLHRRFISLNTGSCHFIYERVRVDISNKIHRFANQNMTPPKDIFDPAIRHVETYLRQQHALFILSPEFNEFLHRYSNGFGQEPPLDEELAEHCYVNEETFEEMTLKHPATIASSSVVGSSVVDDDLQPSTSGYQHYQSRTGLDEPGSLIKVKATSNNGISKSMTRSEPNVANFKLKFSEHSSTDDGFGGKQSRHRKEPRERLRNKEKQNQHSGMRHDRPEQRLEFANLLTQKLSAIADEISILERQFGKVIYAREIPEYRQQLENSFTQSQTHNQPPYANQKQATAPAFAMWSQPPLQQPQPSMFHSFGPPMASSTTAATVAATSGFEPDDEDDDVNEFERRLHQRSKSISPAPFPPPKAPRDRRFSPYGNGGFAPPPPANSSKSGNSQHQQYPRYDHRQQPQYSYMGSSYMPHYLSFSDSSGFFSADSALGNPHTFNDPARMKKLYEKARENNAQASTVSAPTASNHHINHNIVGSSQTLMRKTSATPHQIASHPQSATLPRPSRPTGSANEMTVSLREPGQMAFVSKCEPKNLTLREFRHLFGVSSRTTKRFFFKSSCDDGDDPYQWTAIEHDDHIVPIFEGKITAECRTMSDSD